MSLKVNKSAAEIEPDHRLSCSERFSCNDNTNSHPPYLQEVSKEAAMKQKKRKQLTS